MVNDSEASWKACATWTPFLALTSKNLMPLALQNYSTYYLLTFLFSSSQSTLLPKRQSCTLGAAYFSIWIIKRILNRARSLRYLRRCPFWWYRRRWWWHELLCNRLQWWFWIVTVLQYPRFVVWQHCLQQWWTWFRLWVLEPEINSYGSEVAFLKGVIGESSKKWGLAYWAVADEDNFEEKIVLTDHYGM